MQKSKCNSAQCELTGGGAAPDVTDDTDESERVGQVSALWITTFKRLLWIKALFNVYFLSSEQLEMFGK